MPSHPEPQLQTRAIHTGVDQDTQYRSVITPIYPSSCFAFEELDKPPPFDYTRSGNPTRQALNDSLASLEGGCSAFAVSSGITAIHTVLMLLERGDHVVCGQEIYGGTHRLFSQILPRLGIQFSYVDMTDLVQIQAALRADAPTLIVVQEADFLSTPSGGWYG